jgi:Ser/Thr protein kinase RdoA (MazF antagonist)
VVVDVAAWPAVVLGSPIAGGHRNKVWEAKTPEGPVVVRRSRRSKASLEWELQLMEFLDDAGFLVPRPLRTADGQLSEDQSEDQVVVQRWIDGREPTTEADWRLVAAELVRLHEVGARWMQRPTCLAVTQLGRMSRSVDADLSVISEDIAQEILGVFAEFGDVPTSVVHGDPGESNIRITAEGQVGLLDWDESRVDVVFHDLSNLGCQVLSDTEHACAGRLSDAWETANAWVAEPQYAMRRLADLRRR